MSKYDQAQYEKNKEQVASLAANYPSAHIWVISPGTATNPTWHSYQFGLCSKHKPQMGDNVAYFRSVEELQDCLDAYPSLRTASTSTAARLG